LQGFGGKVMAALPEFVPAGLALAVGNAIELFLVEVHQA
jgi:hypothetical protein